jgi:hypothetical protein
MRPIGLPPLALTLEIEGDFGLEDPTKVQTALQAFRQAAVLAAEFVRGVWLTVAASMDIRGGFGGAGATSYIQGIRAAVAVIESEAIGPWSAEIVVALSNTSPHAAFVEDGHAAFSLVRAIDWGSTSGRIKRGPKGPYLHIPFRHSVFQTDAALDAGGATYGARKAMMPRDVTREARKLAATIRQNTGPIYRPLPGGGRQFVAADRYKWGGRLDRPGSTAIQVAPSQVSPTGRPFAVAMQERRSARLVGHDAAGAPLVNPAWKTGRFDNLFRTSQPKGGSTYMTIRTITPNSMGWNIPAQLGRHVVQRVAAGLRSGIGAAELQRIVTEPFVAGLGLEVDGG